MHQSAPIEFALRESDSASSYGEFANLLLTYGHGPPNATNASRFAALVSELSERYPRGAGVLVVVESDSSPTPDGREALLAAFRALRGKVSFAFVIQSETFAAAAQRAIIKTLLFVTRYRDCIRLEQSVESGARWLCARVKPGDGRHWDVCAVQRAAHAFCVERAAHYGYSIAPGADRANA